MLRTHHLIGRRSWWRICRPGATIGRSCSHVPRPVGSGTWARRCCPWWRSRRAHLPRSLVEPLRQNEKRNKGKIEDDDWVGCERLALTKTHDTLVLSKMRRYTDVDEMDYIKCAPEWNHLPASLTSIVDCVIFLFKCSKTSVPRCWTILYSPQLFCLFSHHSSRSMMTLTLWVK